MTRALARPPVAHGHAPLLHQERAVEISRAYAIPSAVAYEILAWPDLDDFEGLTRHLMSCGYSICEIGAVAYDAAIDEARALRKSDPFVALGEAAAAVVARLKFEEASNG